MKSGINLTPRSRAETSWVKFTSTSGTWFQVIWQVSTVLGFPTIGLDGCGKTLKLEFTWHILRSPLIFVIFLQENKTFAWMQVSEQFCMVPVQRAKQVWPMRFLLSHRAWTYNAPPTNHYKVWTRWLRWSNGHQTEWVMFWALFYPYPLKKLRL